VELVICPGSSFSTIPFFMPLRALSVVSFVPGSQAFLAGEDLWLLLVEGICSVPGLHTIQEFRSDSSASWWQLVQHLLGIARWIG
jgi:hypothetical protein